MDKIILNNRNYEEFHTALRARYGLDINLMGLSLNAVLNKGGFEPEIGKQIHTACGEWKHSGDYRDYYTGNLEKKLLEIENSERMKTLSHSIMVHVYRCDEGYNV